MYQKNKKGDLQNYIQSIDFLTAKIVQSANITEFAAAIEKHEEILSELLETKTVKTTLFPDFDGAIKSLGAWGGDFVMVVSQNNPKHYFTSRGYETVLLYDEMILS
jgi:hypothetical protein